MRYGSLIIVGAPRSGTNMLRNILTALPGVDTWPCDEINYIWRHSNVRHPSDEFNPDMARPEVCKFIRKQFDWVSEKYRAHTVVEKTCANSLRVGFVDKVMPGAKYVFIRRDGLDAVGSAIKRWKAELDIAYLARKARFVPLKDIPYYSVRFFWNRLYRFLSTEKRLAFWGPKLDGMEKLLESYSLEEVCALQWKRCVVSAVEAFKSISGERWIQVEYENFVTNPVAEFERILSFIGVDANKEACSETTKNVSPRSIGKGRKDLGDDTVERLTPILRDALV